MPQKQEFVKKQNKPHENLITAIFFYIVSKSVSKPCEEYEEAKSGNGETNITLI